jgi:hypothetical protein
MHHRIRSVGIVGAALTAALGPASGACGGSKTSTTTGEGGTSSMSVAIGVCTSPMPVVVNGVNIGFVKCAEGYQHRASVVNCATVPATPGSCMSTPDAGALAASTCKTDSDCTMYPHGRCDYQPSQNNSVPGGGDAGTTPAECACSYPSNYCLTDSDCSAGDICECGDNGGRCIHSICASDAACTGGALCIPAQSQTTLACDLGSDTYACQTPSDQCAQTSDCAPGPNMEHRFCQLDSSSGVRTCVTQTCIGGRPFLVANEARLAPVRERSDWSACDVAPNVAVLSPAARAALAQHWTEMARMEHASIAAFARFALELLALGAPASLVERTHAAMADETAHARAAFALASAYAGRDVGPGPLAIDGALGAVSARSVFATLAREGCIGETLAAVEATEAAGIATDEGVRTVLTKIARDETAHAELAWRTAAWLAANGDDDFREWARAELARAIDEREHGRGFFVSSCEPSSAGAGARADETRSHGLLDIATKSALVHASLRDVVEPLAASAIMAHASAIDGGWAGVDQTGRYTQYVPVRTVASR